MTSKKTVLLTNAYGPHELSAWGEDPSDLMSARLSRGHGIFGLTAHSHCWALYLIAENISNPCVVLENPHWGDFVHEVRKGHDVIGISMKSMYTPRVARMVKAIRAMSPKSQVVVGGYGVSALEDDVPADVEGDADYLRNNVDHFCRGEGVRYMRRLLGDLPIDRPFTQAHMPLGSVTSHYPFRKEKPVAGISVSLGCPAGCNFCNTSACFFRKKIPIATPKDVYETLKSCRERRGLRKYPDAFLYDEDLFLASEFPRELGRLIRSDRRTWGMQWGSFGSIKALGQFEPEELRECGCTSIWIGVESAITANGKTRTGFAKRHGVKSEREVIEGLRRCGIRVTASIILAFDFHTPENIEADIDAFLSLKPTFYQIAPLLPCPGTLLYKQMQNCGRIHEGYRWEDFHLWQDNGLKRDNFAKGEVKNYFDLAHERLRTLHGPPLVQIFEDNISAYETFRNSDSEYRRFLAEHSQRTVMQLTPVMQAIKDHPPSPQVRQRINELEERAIAIFGPPSLWTRCWHKLLGLVADWRISRAPWNPPQTMADAPLRITHYNAPGAGCPITLRNAPHHSDDSSTENVTPARVKPNTRSCAIPAEPIDAMSW